MFLKPRVLNGSRYYEVVALECIFYQTDCFYYKLKRNPDPVNRMGTENYKLADFDDKLRDFTFDEEPINLQSERSMSYTKCIDHHLMKTIKRDSKVQYMLSRWLVNLGNGGIIKLDQSEHFRLDGFFKVTSNKERRL